MAESGGEVVGESRVDFATLLDAFDEVGRLPWGRLEDVEEAIGDDPAFEGVYDFMDELQSRIRAETSAPGSVIFVAGIVQGLAMARKAERLRPPTNPSE